MREIIGITHVSLDGVMQAPGGPDEDTDNGFSLGGWSMPLFDEEAGKLIGAIMERDFDLLLGRRTYDIFASYWPQQEGPIADLFNKVNKYVVTHRAEGLDWVNTVQVDGDIVEELRQLKAANGRELHVWGSSKLMQALTAAGLVDEYRLFVFPLLLGEGKRLFEAGVPPRSYSLVESQRTPAGVLYNVYRPAGPVETGSA